MTAHKLPIAQVKTLPYYGRHFPFIPWSLTSKLRVSVGFARHLFNEIGLFSFIGFWVLVPFRIIRVYAKYQAGFRLMGEKFGLIAETEWILLTLMYRVLERKEGQQQAYQFAQSAIQDCSRFMMNDFYHADRLAEFEDPFEAFWSYHKAMFQGDPNYPNEFIEEKDLKVMVVHQCRNCEIARLTIPELAPLGCDHDITGYKAIEAKAHMEFRRPQTLAKDGQACRFMFYRQGTAPQGEYTNH